MGLSWFGLLLHKRIHVDEVEYSVDLSTNVGFCNGGWDGLVLRSRRHRTDGRIKVGLPLRGCDLSL